MIWVVVFVFIIGMVGCNWSKAQAGSNSEPSSAGFKEDISSEIETSSAGTSLAGQNSSLPDNGSSDTKITQPVQSKEEIRMEKIVDVYGNGFYLSPAESVKI